ncbi:MAG: autotransporter domain-containing protein, partial [Rhodovibrionaceae bacterium]
AGIDQSVVAGGGGVADATVDNSGSLSAEATALAESTGFSASANASAAAFGVLQEARSNGNGGNATATVLNSSADSIDVSVLANATASLSANAAASGAGIAQLVQTNGNNGTVSGTVDNSGTLNVAVTALADSDSGSANASAAAVGIAQEAQTSGPNSSQTLTAINSSSSSIDVSAVANAEASSTAIASATAIGTLQEFNPSGPPGSPSLNANYTNSGAVEVSAIAVASGASGSANAFADAAGLRVVTSADALLTVDIGGEDTATMNVLASASGGTVATAYGLHVMGPNVSGSIAHTGNSTVHADAGASGNASAYGILLQTDTFNGTVGNYGNLEVSAVGGNATASGIVVEALTGTGSGTGNIVVENDGTLIAPIAISTLNAPNSSEIRQIDGLILGDVWLSNVYADTFNIFAGTVEGDTFGDGDGTNDDVMNFMSGIDGPTPVYRGNVDGLLEINVHPGSAYFDGMVTDTGSLNILDDGRLIVSSEDAPNGPSQINVGEFNQSSMGTLAFEVSPNANSAGQIQTQGGGDANLAGTIEVVPLPGFYDPTTEYHNVIDAGTNGGTVNGTFDTVQDTALLDLMAIYEADETVDLTLTRLAFDSPDGLTRNQRAVGGGIENAYEPGIAGTEYGDMIASLFLLDLEEYRERLDQLGGAEYAQGLQSLIQSQRMFRNSIFDHLGFRRGGGGGDDTAFIGRFDYLSDQLASAGTDETGTASSPQDTQQAARMADRRRDPGTVSVWARAYGNFGDLDGDENASSFEEDQYGFAVGGDVRVAESVALGLAGGYSESDLDFANNNSIDYDGFQVGLYGTFDPGAFYLDAMVSYAWYDNDSRRDTGPTGTARGDYDSEVFSVQAEAGYAFDLYPATITPFLGVRYTEAMTDSYDESGAGAANLSVDDSDAESLTTTLGVDFSAEFKASEEVTIIPSLRLGWEHEFDDSHQSIGAHFVGVPASSFTVIGSDVADDSAVVGAGVTVDIGQTWQLFLDYDGRINPDYDQHAVSGGVRLSW